LQQQLVDTGDARIVYVCASDGFLGSGCDAKTLAEEGSYRGKNWLGKSLMKLRAKLQVLALRTPFFVYYLLSHEKFKFCFGLLVDFSVSRIVKTVIEDVTLEKKTS